MADNKEDRNAPFTCFHRADICIRKVAATHCFLKFSSRPAQKKYNKNKDVVHLMRLFLTRFRCRIAIASIANLVALWSLWTASTATNSASWSYMIPVGGSCNVSDPEAVAACLKHRGLESIFHRLSKSTVIDDPWKATLFARLDRIQFVCGTLCQMNTRDAIQNNTEVNPKGTLPLVRVPDVDCTSLIGMEDIDAGAGGNLSDPKAIPEELSDYFTIGGSYERIDENLRSDVYLGGVAKQFVWTKQKIESNMALLAKGKLDGSYGTETTNGVRDTLLNHRVFDIRNKSILVIGSEQPWLESICLYAGAKHVTTLEYGKILSQHPQISTLTPDEFRIKYRNVAANGHGTAGGDGTVGRSSDEDLFFDGMVSYSSLEHSGLGRYGDALNPWGDILAVARAWCVTKNHPSSFMILGVPTGNDTILSNWHRVYGKIRWPLLAANWRHVDRINESELEQNNPSAEPRGRFLYSFEKVVYNTDEAVA